MHKVIAGDSLTILRTLAEWSVDMCMTSPPYWGLRDYGHDKQLGLEPTPELYIEHMTEIFGEVKRVLKKEGTLWLNIGDTYSGGGVTNNERENKQVCNIPPRGSGLILPKCLCMIPERLAWSLIQDGWILRNKIIWYKPNGMPSSVKDRFTNKHEYIYLFSQSKKYYFDLDAVREPHAESGIQRMKYPVSDWRGSSGKSSWCQTKDNPDKHIIDYNPSGKNPGDVFIVNTQPFPEAHFAVFPEKLCEKPIKAGCPKDGTVLDPFCGAGTTGVVAKKLGRSFIGIEINDDYAEMSRKRIIKVGYQQELFK